MANPDLPAGALAKPRRGTRKREKAKAKRAEKVVAKSVRAQVEERDGYCIIDDGGWPLEVLLRLGMCTGPSEWAHVGAHRRCHTRGQAPAQRHTVKGSAKLCQRHHRDYDAHKFDLQYEAERSKPGPFKPWIITMPDWVLTK